LFLHYYSHPQTLLSFPTRRSSDLNMDFRFCGFLRAGLGTSASSSAALSAWTITKSSRARFSNAVIGGLRSNAAIGFPGGLSTKLDRKSTRLKSSHLVISYDVFRLK